MRRISAIVIVVTALLGIASTAAALPITYSVSGVAAFNLGDPASGFRDTLALNAGGGSFEIGVGETKVEALNALVWWVGNSPVRDGSTVIINQPRSITVNGTQSLPLLGNIVYHDLQNQMLLQIDSGNTITFVLDGGYLLDVTPIAYEKWANPGVDYYMPSDQLMGTFTLRSVPDGGATLTLLGCALVGLGALRRKLRR
jgi:hypothetical protein